MQYHIKGEISTAQLLNLILCNYLFMPFLYSLDVLLNMQTYKITYTTLLQSLFIPVFIKGANKSASDHITLSKPWT